MSESSHSSPDGNLRIMSWNIHKGVGGLDRRYDLDRTIAVIRHYDPDIVLLQEVAQGIRSLRQHNQVEILSQALPLYAIFHLEHQWRVGGYGNMILSRWPIVEPNHLDLTIGDRKRRGSLQAHVRTHLGEHQRSIVVHNIHLGLAGRERSLQLQRLVASHQFSRLHQRTPVVVGGDLNDLWGTLGIKYLLPAGLTRAGTAINTFPSTLPLRPLDGLYFRGGLVLRHFAVAKYHLARQASDHLPIYADFALQAA